MTLSAETKSIRSTQDSPIIAQEISHHPGMGKEEAVAEFVLFQENLSLAEHTRKEENRSTRDSFVPGDRLALWILAPPPERGSSPPAWRPKRSPSSAHRLLDLPIRRAPFSATFKDGGHSTLAEGRCLGSLGIYSDLSPGEAGNVGLQARARAERARRPRAAPAPRSPATATIVVIMRSRASAAVPDDARPQANRSSRVLDA